MGRLTYDDLDDYFAERDLALCMSMAAVRKLHGDRVRTLGDEILSFVSQRVPDDPFGRYLERVRSLQSLQEAFDRAGCYAASSYAEVPKVDLEDYNLALLLSFVMTNHRFEILEKLESFLASPMAAPARLLSVGFGSGYELKVAQRACPGSEILAFDRSIEAAAYAGDLLRHFGCDVSCLRLGTFPLESDEGIERYEAAFGKIVLCEVLEHLEDPAHAIRNLARTLAPDGRMFLTMAINLAQEDHIYLYRTPEDARRQVLDQALEIESEWITPVTIKPFAEKDRERIFKRGNYVCVARPGR